MAHKLLGFQSYSIAETTKLQNETVEQDGVKFGRDSNDLFSTYSGAYAGFFRGGPTFKNYGFWVYIQQSGVASSRY